MITLFGPGSIVGAGLERYRGVFTSPHHRILIGASTLSDLGDWLNIVALSLIAYRVGDGILAVGIMLVIRKLPGLLLQLPAGAFIDRFQGPSVLISSQVLLAAIAASLTMLLLIPSLWLLLVLVLMMEVVNVVTYPAFAAAIARWTDQTHRGAMNALLSLENSLARMLGPVLGSVILVVSNAGVLFIANGISYLVAAAAVWWVWKQRVDPDPSRSLPGADAGTQPDPVAAPGFAAYKAMVLQTDLAFFLGTTVLDTILMQGAVTIFIVRAVDLGFGESGLGVFHAALAAGALAGGIVAGLGKYTSGSVILIIAIAEGVNAIGYGLFAMLSQPAVVLLVLVVVGISAEMSETPALTYFQNTMPEEQFGRLFSLFLLAANLGAIAGLLIVPWLGIRFGEERALLVLSLAGLVIATGFGVWARRWLRSVAEPELMAAGETAGY